MKRMIFLFGVVAVLMATVSLMMNSNQSVSAAPALQAPDGQAYVVQADDWLSKIADKFLSDSLAFDLIVEATNTKAAEDDSFATIDDPNLIEVGQQIWIPTSGTVTSTGIAAPGDQFFPESVAVHDGYAYVSAFFTGEVQKINLATGATEPLVETGTDGVIAGWGLWYDNANDVLLACGNKNFVPGLQTEINSARAINPSTGAIVESWDLPEGTACNSILTDAEGNIYLSDVGTNASIVKIDRITGEAITWADDPAWENESGFGVGGLIWDGADNLYASAGGPLYRIPINADGAAGTPVQQTLLDVDGNELPGLGFDGFVWAGNGTMYGAAFDFAAFQSQVVKAVVIDDQTVQTEVVFTSAVGVTGLDYDSGTIYAADGQIIQALFNKRYEPTAPFTIFEIPGDLAVDTTDVVAGDWASIACEVRPNFDGTPLYITRDISFSGGQIDIRFHNFADAACAEPTFSWYFGGTYELLGPSDAAADAVQGNITIDQVGITPDVADLAGFFNSVGNDDCGTATWEVGVEQDITATGCSLMGLPANNITQEYETFYQYADFLAFAARPINGTFLDTPDKRSTALLTPLVRAGVDLIGDAANIAGSWQSVSNCEVRPAQSADGLAPNYLTRDIVFSGDEVNIEFQYFNDAACTQPSLTFHFDGVTEIVGESAAAPGASQVNLTIDQVRITPDVADLAGFLNSAGDGDCGTTTWEVGVEQLITETGCTLMGVAPNQITEEYETLLALDNYLFFGARPIDGTFLSDPNQRPNALLVPLVRQ